MPSSPSYHSPSVASYTYHAGYSRTKGYQLNDDELEETRSYASAPSASFSARSKQEQHATTTTAAASSTLRKVATSSSSSSSSRLVPTRSARFGTAATHLDRVLEEEEAGFLDSLFGGCICGDVDNARDTTTTNTKTMNGGNGSPLQRRANGTLPSTEQLAKVLRQITEAPACDQGSYALDFAVDYLVPLQLLSKWATLASSKSCATVQATEQRETNEYNDEDPNLKRHRAIFDDGAAFLRDVSHLGGVTILLKFFVDHMEDPASVLCAIRALHAMLLERSTQDQFKPSKQNSSGGGGATQKAKDGLIQEFVEQGGVEIVLHAWDKHAVDGDNNLAKKSSESSVVSQKELQLRCLDLLQILDSPADAAAVIRTVVGKSVTRLLAATDNQQVNRKALLAQESLLANILTLTLDALNVERVERHLTLGHVLDLVHATTVIRRTYPINSDIASHAQAVWAWAAEY